MAASTVEIHVDVVTDNVCPWCYVGKKKMDVAIAQFPAEVHFTVIDQNLPILNPGIADQSLIVDWVPYVLKLPAELESHEGKSNQLVYREFLLTRFGEQSAKQMLHTLIKAGESLGIKFCHERPILSDTLLSHCLIQYAKCYNLQNQAAEAIMKAYCEDGADVSQLDVLVEIANSIGLNGIEAERVIGGKKCQEEMRKMAEEVKNKSGITSVPTFIVSRPGITNYRIKFSGAQPVEYFVAAFKQMIDPKPVRNTSISDSYQCPPNTEPLPKQ